MLRKPVNRNEHIRKFSREHHFCLVFCWKIREGLKKGIAIERICKYVQYFWEQHLHPHFQAEERILFASFKDNVVQRAVREHKCIRQLLESLEKYSKINTRKSLEELAEMVEEHVRYEERQLFPHLERNLRKDQLENIGKQTQKHQHLSLPDQYEDQFWNIHSNK